MVKQAADIRLEIQTALDEYEYGKLTKLTEDLQRISDSSYTFASDAVEDSPFSPDEKAWVKTIIQKAMSDIRHGFFDSVEEWRQFLDYYVEEHPGFRWALETLVQWERECLKIVSEGESRKWEVWRQMTLTSPAPSSY